MRSGRGRLVRMDDERIQAQRQLALVREIYSQFTYSNRVTQMTIFHVPFTCIDSLC